MKVILNQDIKKLGKKGDVVEVAKGYARNYLLPKKLAIVATSNNLDAYLAEFNFVDGSIVAPSTFGITDTSTGRWIPKSLTGITYGTNGFRMEYANSAGQTIGDDTSGNLSLIHI